MMLVDDFKGLWIKGFFGYLIGLELALISYSAGQQIAILIHRYTNPFHAKEADVMKKAPETHIYHHRELPDFERQYLSSILEKEYTERLRKDFPQLIEKLNEWKESTSDHRKPFGPLIEELKEIECVCIAQKCDKDIRHDLREVAEQTGWNIDALQEYMLLKRSASAPSKNDPKLTYSSSIHLSSLIIVLTLVILILILILPKLETGMNHDYKNFYVFCLAIILGPFGAITRWLLSKYNGSLKAELKWVPIGTFAANFLASVISIVIGGVIANSDISISDTTECVLRAISVGAVGSTSTVSSFVAEINKLMVSFPIHLWSYSYVFVTLVTCCMICSLIYYVLSV